ncbi:ISAs1 family transposase [Streptomyces canus]|uniref:ISAs1 family transposase n=1 Tax=Streptomyces canus TaxID=58343 RepID=UPI00216B4BAC|nr:ISAs1 family transposase [Streptomyces canus]
MPAAVSSPLPAVLVKLVPLDAGRVADRLLAVIGIRRHLLRWLRTPSPATIGRVLGTVDGDALDRAVGAYLADQHRAATEPAQTPSPSASGRPRVIAVDGKALKGSARLTATRRHLLSAVTHGTVVTLAQVEVGVKTNETTHFQPLLAPLDLTSATVTFDALHSVKANISWLVETKKAHYIAVIKTNQPTAHSQPAALPWRDIAVQHTASDTGHGRRESRDQDLRRRGRTRRDRLPPTPVWPSASTAAASRPASARPARVCRHQPRRPPGRPADLAAAIRGHWGVENSSHHIRDVTFAEDASTVHTGTAPRAMAPFRNLAIGMLKTLGADNIAKTTRAIRDEP